MTEKQLKEYEKEVAAMQDEKLSEFQQKIELSGLDGSTKRELLKYIDARRETLSNTHSLFAECGEIKEGDLE